MLLKEWSLRTDTPVASEVLYAASVLERYGFMFSYDFSISDAIDRCTTVLCDHADEEERLLMEGKQIADKIKVDEEPRIQDRRTSSTFRRNRQNSWDI